jgi:hypothetical protein
MSAVAMATADNMTEPADDKRIEHRAGLTPEEQEAGSDDPEAQAAAILRESDERVADPEGDVNR